MNIFDNVISRWLNTIVYDRWFFQVDYWSGVHFIMGFILGKIIPFTPVVFVLLVIYEIFEVLLYGVVFRQEPLKNIFSDIVIGMIGFYIGRAV